ncbi:aryl-alcohol dehydrogenase-like predicted oxidoreductase [Saccharothrix tamanrassetensis]|uniref:Aryl-alcohol dehydrogenase-like predicted oxidoreductase n=1 Tax=Saccharothrix tamanrassetensis TaxID=1051531 RepID=A0A841C7M9_9PSEU|nr:aldo/keto reductase [Saccharothrix tamanrassetensis]MBB5954502.1 aryl-alcohol dehydrogenase-like predicted oxidoreductase [Saccharothrix tamanrassetensis]
MTKLGTSDLDVSRLCLGGNVFGWTADEEASFAVLDAYVAAGGNFVDTADVYSAWGDAHVGGESETVIGRWLKARGNRDAVIVATKVGMLEVGGLDNLRADTIATAAENSLRRLGVDHIDLYYAHQDDPKTPQEETLAAFDALVKAGKVRYVAASNYTAARLTSALEVSEREGFAEYVALQQHYNLVERSYEGELSTAVADAGLSSAPYWSLAKGFLTGKYRPGVEVESVRAAGASKYLDDRGLRVLAALDEVAAAHGTSVASVALAWLAAQPTVAAPIASARTADQLDDLLPALELELKADEIARLTAASEVQIS